MAASNAAASAVTAADLARFGEEILNTVRGELTTACGEIHAEVLNAVRGEGSQLRLDVERQINVTNERQDGTLRGLLDQVATLGRAQERLQLALDRLGDSPLGALAIQRPAAPLPRRASRTSPRWIRMFQPGQIRR